MTADMAVIICSNREPGRMATTLQAVDRQTIRSRLEVVVVDDGAPAPLADAYGGVDVRFLRHVTNRGLAAARNTGLAASKAPVVAFTDDDCIPAPEWAEKLLGSFADESVIAAGGPVWPTRADSYLLRYYVENNPLAPLEFELGASRAPVRRLVQYVKGNVAPHRRTGARAVYTVAGANVAFRRTALAVVGGFDAEIRFGGEDEDIFERLREALPDRRVQFVPEAAVSHTFDPSLRDALRRARAYGRGNARNCVKHPTWRPTIYPAPLAGAAFLTIGLRRRRWLMVALLLPVVSAPRWAVSSFKARAVSPIGFAYIQFAQEAATNLGFLPAWWHFRRSLGEHRTGYRTPSPSRPSNNAPSAAGG